MTTEHNSEQITKECKADLKEIKNFFGGWDELRKVIAKLEENENEEAFDRYMENRMDAPSVGETAEMMHRIQRDLK